MFEWIKKIFEPYPQNSEEQRKIEEKRNRLKELFSNRDNFGEYSNLENNENLREAHKNFVNAHGNNSANPTRKTSTGMDDQSGDSYPNIKSSFATNNNDGNQLLNWYACQSQFIGWQNCAMLATHWLIDKACSIPARDATRQGYSIVSTDNDILPIEALQIFKRYDKKFSVNEKMIDFVRFGRIFGIRICLFKIESDDPNFYKNPFNLDGVKKGSYKGLVNVDPYWCTPLLDMESSAEQNSLHFYEPTWWNIGGKLYHRTHLMIFKHAEPADYLKPAYMYGGVPLTQQLYERVYAGERMANEAPMLALTKRTVIFKTDLAAFNSLGDKAIARVSKWSKFKDNFATFIADKNNEEVQQMDVSLTDLDKISQFEFDLVCAISRVPSVKLLENSPTGFNATGEYANESYRETLESIQTHDLTPLLERHHALVMKSYIMPKLGIEFIDTEVQWNALDSPKALECADIELKKAQVSQIYMEMGVTDSTIEKNRLLIDKDNPYSPLLDSVDIEDDE